MGGSTGMIGTLLTRLLQERGDRVKSLVRPSSKISNHNDGIPWDPAAGTIDREKLEGIDAVIHLGGESIASGLWTEARKKRLTDSRILSTSLLAETLAKLEQKPEVFLCASGISIYGDGGDHIFDEAHPPDNDFLANLAHEWEKATQPARDAGIRVVNLRIGVVLALEGGALAKMAPAFRLGLGGPIGNGRQYMSWIEVDDLTRAILHCMDQQKLDGPVNLISPFPVTNKEFAAVLGRTLKRPAILPAPAFMIKLIFGEMGRSVLLGGTRGSCKKLEDSGFVFQYPNLEDALQKLFKK